MGEQQFSLMRFDKGFQKEEICNIYVSHTKDYSDWSVNADNYMVYYHSSGMGYKGKTPQDKISILIKEITQDLNDKGYFNIEVQYSTASEKSEFH